LNDIAISTFWRSNDKWPRNDQEMGK